MTTMPKKPAKIIQPASFDDAMQELERLVVQMEAGELPLETLVAAYKRGAELVRFCAAQLDRIDDQVRTLEGDMLKPLITDAAEARE